MFWWMQKSVSWMTSLNVFTINALPLRLCLVWSLENGLRGHFLIYQYSLFQSILAFSLLSNLQQRRAAESFKWLESRNEFSLYPRVFARFVDEEEIEALRGKTKTCKISEKDKRWRRDERRADDDEDLCFKQVRCVSDNVCPDKNCLKIFYNLIDCFIASIRKMFTI